jgi:hypothetical protein
LDHLNRGAQGQAGAQNQQDARPSDPLSLFHGHAAQQPKGKKQCDIADKIDEGPTNFRSRPVASIDHAGHYRLEGVQGYQVDFARFVAPVYSAGHHGHQQHGQDGEN